MVDLVANSSVFLSTIGTHDFVTLVMLGFVELITMICQGFHPLRLEELHEDFEDLLR